MRNTDSFTIAVAMYFTLSYWPVMAHGSLEAPPSPVEDELRQMFTEVFRTPILTKKNKFRSEFFSFLFFRTEIANFLENYPYINFVFFEIAL